jgi:exopolyphosphatase/guanosine-5'-triphosphate,3'-diphosphate pyrophosphatase
MKLAAIDVGSNAVRLLLSSVSDHDGQPTFTKDSLVRMPLRLGEEVFPNRAVSAARGESLVKIMQAFRLLIDAYGAEAYLACATSALREAWNGAAVAEAVHDRAKIDLQIVDGRREAEIICSTGFGDVIDPGHTVLYIDVGGGSTELTLFAHGKLIDSRSFNVGAIRALQRGITEQVKRDMRAWLRDLARRYETITGIGSGGNINKIFRLSRVKDDRPMTYDALEKIHRFLASHTVEERITELHLRPDRADVIVPAAEIFLTVMKWANMRRLFVPQIGLVDGLIHELYHRRKVEGATR